MGTEWWLNFAIMAGFLTSVLTCGYPAIVGIHYRHFYKGWAALVIAGLVLSAAIVSLVGANDQPLTNPTGDDQ